VCENPVKRNQCGIMCDGCTQVHCGGVEVSKTSLQHPESHSEDCAKKWNIKNGKGHKTWILANRKQKYNKNTEEKAASRL